MTRFGGSCHGHDGDLAPINWFEVSILIGGAWVLFWQEKIPRPEIRFKIKELYAVPCRGGLRLT
jgi:hypothetical protein